MKSGKQAFLFQDAVVGMLILEWEAEHPNTPPSYEWLEKTARERDQKEGYGLYYFGPFNSNAPLVYAIQKLRELGALRNDVIRAGTSRLAVMSTPRLYELLFAIKDIYGEDWRGWPVSIPIIRRDGDVTLDWLNAEPAKV